MCTFSCQDPSKCDGGTCPLDVQFYMLLDSDRDGVVEDKDLVNVVVHAAKVNNWEWGKGKLGAVILCNNDDDDSKKKEDNLDSTVNGGSDKEDLAPLLIVRVGKDKPPASMKGTLEVDAALKDRIRIFDKRDAGGTEIIGPKAGNKFELPDLNFESKEFGIEAVTYMGGGFDGLIKIQFSIKHSSGSYTREGVVRVAPWVMPNHLDAAETVFVVDAGSFNKTFRDELGKMVGKAGCSLVQHPSIDIWMQDCMEFGYSNLPPDKGFRTVMRAPRSDINDKGVEERELITFPKTLLKPDLGFTDPDPPIVTSKTFDSSGNLEATPPCKSKSGKNYPLGRIYYGPGRPLEKLNKKLKDFLKSQVVQEPIEVPNEWLAVGHVDEIISFVPAPGAQGFKMLLASPKLAYDILNAHQAKNGKSKLLTGRDFGGKSAEVTIDRFLTKGISKLKLKAKELKRFNDDKQLKLDAIKALFENEIGIDATNDIIEIPSLFMPNDGHPTLADALTAGMVNMLVLNKHCIVPKPWGPVVGGQDMFEKDVTDKLGPLGLTVSFLDDWHEYHVMLGEVHCGTNTLRKPKDAKWWEFNP